MQTKAVIHTNPDTITAIATPPGKSAIGIVRLSGPKTFDILKLIWQPINQTTILDPNKLTPGWVADGHTKVDQVMVVYMPAPNSYNGEDMAEIHCHGSQIILSSVLGLVVKHGAKVAEAGEFTRRAFLNGKLDLMQVEAVADLIEGESTQLAKLAAFQLSGGLSASIDNIKDKLLGLAASSAANLDFSEEDLEDSTVNEQIVQVTNLISETKKLIESSKSLPLIRDGYKVALVGLPNAGKSTLLNTLVGYDRAIVTDVAGTTRDTLTETITYKNLNFHFTDTAGLTATKDQVEALGVQRSQLTAKNSNLVLLLVEPGCEKDTKKYLEKEGLSEVIDKNKCLVVYTKQDLESKSRHKERVLAGLPCLKISAKTQAGIAELLTTIYKKACANHNPNSALLLTHRQISVVTKLHKQLKEVQTMLGQNLPNDILQVEYQRALSILGTLTGDHVTEDVIDGIFSRFCIGK